MSESQSQNLSRQVARRAFATEFNDATHHFKEGDDERSPRFALLPTGVRANRFFTVGTITESGNVSDESEYWRGRVVDPTGTFFVYAGQYQPDAMSFLRSVNPPAFVSVVGKPRSFERDDGGTSVTLRPEHITIVDAHTRNQWVCETAERTVERVNAFETADPDTDTDDPDITLAREQYTNLDVPSYRDAAIEAVESLRD